MTKQKAAIQNEIEAAKRKLRTTTCEDARQHLRGYIKGLNQSLYVLSKKANKNKELNY